MENGNKEPEKLSADVGDFVETILARQTAFEASVNEKIAATNRRLEDIFALQQDALREAVTTLKVLISGKTDWKRPPAGNATTN